MVLPLVLVITSVLTLSFAIVYTERRVRGLDLMTMQRDECLRYAALFAAHRSGDAKAVEVLESFGGEDDEAVIHARKDAFEASEAEAAVDRVA